MEEREWLACAEPGQLLDHLASHRRQPSEEARRRKALLLVCACCRRWSQLSPASCAALEIAERFADGLAAPEDVRAAREAGNAENASWRWVADTALRTAEALTFDHHSFRLEDARYPLWALNVTGSAEEFAAQCDLVRDLFGNPFRPATIEPAWLQWGGGVPVAIAGEIYEGRAFDQFPILADALEEAGCIDATLLGHCRQPTEHARGCWVIDHLLGLG